MKALHEGAVDFHDPKVKFTGAKVDMSAKLNRDDILEVDLGDMSSLPSDQIHINE